MSNLKDKDIEAPDTEVAVIGAGPYGLSVAAHLGGAGIPYRIFGSAMSSWAHHMPRGMKLKSDGFASSLADPSDEFTLKRYCADRNLPYHDEELPVELETFVAYGRAFQQKYVPNLEDRKVVSIHRSRAGFLLRLDSGESLQARRVIMAIGILQFAYVPEVLDAVPAAYVSHSSVHSDLEMFRGKQVVVLGAGSSALDIAVLLHKVGASVQIVARKPIVRFHCPPEHRGTFQKLTSPTTGIGAGLDFYFYTTLPHIFRLLPESLRLDRVRKTLGPAGGWFIREDAESKVPIHVNRKIRMAIVHGNELALEVTDGHQSEMLTVDHLISATGYRVDVNSIGILAPELRAELRVTGRSPLLSAYFESSASGLYFVGVTSANTFGPMMRFAFGARFTARRITRHLRRMIRPAGAP